MSSSRVLPLLRPLLPWICSSLALGYAAYVHYQMRRIAQCAKREQINKNPDIHPARHVVNVDEIDREKYSKKNRVSYCRCWKSKTFPFCDGPGHHCHNKENNDKVGPLVLTWNVEPSEQPIVDTASSTNANADSTKLTN